MQKKHSEAGRAGVGWHRVAAGNRGGAVRRMMRSGVDRTMRQADDPRWRGRRIKPNRLRFPQKWRILRFPPLQGEMAERLKATVC